MDTVKIILKISVTAVATLLFSLLAYQSAKAAIIFPVIGPSSYSNDFYSPRGDDIHHATDILAYKRQRVVSATDGVIQYVEYPQRGSQGYMVIVRSTAGNSIYYIHLNNDNAGTDDGRGGGMQAYAPDVKAGNPVKKGQLLGWVGDSGNAESTVPHLHFEIRSGGSNGDPINPYPLLKNDSVHISAPRDYPELPNEILPFGAAYKGKINVARGDVTGDGTEDLIAGADGIGKGSRVRVFDPSTKQRLADFYSLSTGLSNGVDVATGDVDGDGKDELITAVKGKDRAKVAVYSYNITTEVFDLVNDFIAYEDFNTVPRVTTGDINGDGNDEIITGTGEGALSIVRAFDAEGVVLKTFQPFPDSFLGGVDVASGDTTSGELPGVDEIAVAPLTTASSRVIIFDANRPADEVGKLKEFYAYGSDYRGGIRLSIGELYYSNPNYEIATTPNNRGRAVFHAFSADGGLLRSNVVLEEWWRGYHDIAASRNGSLMYSLGTGENRRGSIR
jgi:hypothetical protein